MRFARDTAVRRDGDRWLASIVPGWDVLGNANGGYMMAILGRAAIATSERTDVITLSAEFHSPGRAGEVVVETSELRSGRQFTATRLALRSSDKLVMSATVQTGELATFEGPTRVLGARSEIPPPHECIAVEPTDTFPPPFSGQVEVRAHPADIPMISDDPTELMIRGWFRLRDDEPMDSLAAVLACDSSAPTIFNSKLDVGWTPTVQMTINVRRRPPTDWLFMDTRSRFVTDGMIETDCELWTPDGELIAQSRQLALVPNPS